METVVEGRIEDKHGQASTLTRGGREEGRKVVRNLRTRGAAWQAKEKNAGRSEILRSAWKDKKIIQNTESVRGGCRRIEQISQTKRERLEKTMASSKGGDAGRCEREAKYNKRGKTCTVSACERIKRGKKREIHLRRLTRLVCVKKLIRGTARSDQGGTTQAGMWSN